MATFNSINKAYQQSFKPDRLTLGLVVPIERYDDPVPSMANQTETIQRADALGFSAIWLRDVPFNVPSFGDAGQLYDPFVYMGYLAAMTKQIGIGVASLVLPLRHPAHVAKSLASAEQLSHGRILAGIASGDRFEEYPAMSKDFDARGQAFRDHFDYINAAWQPNGTIDNQFGQLNGDLDLLPKPQSGKIPLMMTGGSQQTDEWLAANGDGWLLYPRDPAIQTQIIARWRHNMNRLGRANQPAMQPLYIDLLDDDNAPIEAIHLGIRSGIHALKTYLFALQQAGMNHVAFNLRFNQADIHATLDKLAAELLPIFGAHHD